VAISFTNKTLPIFTTTHNYGAFQGFGQAEFSYGGSILGSTQFTLCTAPAASKNDAIFKSSQN